MIRLRLKRFLERHGGSLTFFPGGEIDANLGHTLVYPLFPLPSPTQELDQMILDFCDQGKIHGKVVGKFRRFGESGVLEALRRLERQKLLESENRYAGKFYSTV